MSSWNDLLTLREIVGFRDQLPLGKV
jgi:hypothetical protein